MHELLVPVGNMECLYQAVMNGADAVYLACKKFGARKYANNFTNEEILQAIKYCHLYGVKVFVTMNTLVKNSEVDDFLEQVLFLHKNGVDAIIMQDFGMISLVREMYPNLEIHASTQANNSSLNTVKMFYEMGVRRVVFSRELSLDEIEKIDVPIEKEVFIHGALCISYSGNCLMSSMIGNRSGNRGECAGSCRLPYKLVRGNKNISSSKYLLSTKELNISYKFKELLKSSIYSFKIEGRMKSPEYVGFITKFYRSLIDNFDNTNLDVENNKLKTIYNRKFTEGHLFGTKVSSIMNVDNPNHIGLPIGKVTRVTSDKIKISLSRTLNQGDGIRFLESGKGLIVNYLYDKNNKLVNSCSSICYVDNHVGLSTCDTVHKTLDCKLNAELKKLPVRKISVVFDVCAKIGQELLITISDGTNTIAETGVVVEKSINNPLSGERIKQQLEKLGNTPFVSVNTVLNLDDDIYINIRDINEIRRRLVERLIEQRSNIGSEVIVKRVSFSLLPFNPNKNSCGYTALVYNEEQLLKCIELKFKRIYVFDRNLYEKYKNFDNVYLKLPRNCFDVAVDSDKFLTNDYITSDLGVGDYFLNVYNIYTAYYLYMKGFKTITLSVELSQDEVKEFVDCFRDKFGVFPPIEIVSFGRCENMLIKGNILNIEANQYDYELVDIKNRKFPVYFDGINTVVLNYRNFNYGSEFIRYADIRYNFFDESSIEIENIVSEF